MRKRELTTAEKQECAKLKLLFNQKKAELGLTQESVAHSLGLSQSGVSHYLNGKNAINLEIAIKFARLLGVEIADFAPRFTVIFSQGPKGKVQIPGSVEEKGETYDFFASLNRVELGQRYRDTSQPVRDMVDELLAMSQTDAERFVRVYRTIKDQMYDKEHGP